MSMIGNYRRVSPKQLSALIADPDSVVQFLYPDDGTEPATEDRLDIDKSWHVIHFLLNGHPWEGQPPLVYAVLGGTELGKEDVGYGPARYLLPAQVGQAAVVLGNITPAELRKRFSPKALADAEIYPEGWTDSPEDFEYIRVYYEELVVFFKSAAASNDAMIVYLN